MCSSDLSGEVREPRGRGVLEGHGEPVRHDFVVASGGLDGQSVELQKLQGVVLAVVARGEDLA